MLRNGDSGTCECKGPLRNLEGEVYVHYLHCGHNFTSINIHQSYQIIFIKYVWLYIYKLYLNKAIKNKEDTLHQRRDTEKHMK